MPTLSAGDKAPDFELPVRGRETVRLSTALEKGPVVLLTYVFDFSPGWTNELSEFGKRLDEFKQLGVQVYGVSVDSTWCHDAWRNQLGLHDELVLLSDFNRQFGQAYGLLNASPSGMKDILRRTVFVIDPDGTIRYRWDVPDPPRIPTADEILEVLRKPAGV